MKKNLLLPALLFALPFLFVACNKEDQSLDSLETTTTDDVLTADDMIQNTEEEIDYQLESRGLGEDCPIVTVTPNDGTYPRTITIDYGTEGCEGPNGHIRKGIIQVVVTDTMINVGASRTVTFIDFSVDDVLVGGTRVKTNTGPNGEGQPTFTREVIDASLTFPNGDIAEWEGEQLITFLEGFSTPLRIDDVWQIEGGSAGVNRNGQAFTSTITTPLIKPFACPWIVSGVREVTINDHTITLDYGNGDCDKFATLTRPDGTTKVVVIRRWW